MDNGIEYYTKITEDGKIEERPIGRKGKKNEREDLKWSFLLAVLFWGHYSRLS